MARIRKVGVLGAGIMGGGIAAHVAGAGVPVLLLDIVPPSLKPEEMKDRAARNRFSDGGKEKALKARPPAFFTKRDALLVETGNLEDDLEKISSCDLIIEAVPEDLKIKQDLFGKLEKVRAPEAIIASNTSGLPLTKMLEGRSADFKKHFIITHFFNPVRFMKLLEVVVGPDTLPEVTKITHTFGEDVLGKGMVYAKDTPNFIANRIGNFAMMDSIRLMMEMDLTIDEVDAILGRPVGHPKVALFKVGDMVGLDTLMHVTENNHEMLPNDEARAVFDPPAFMKEMLKRGMLGDKAKGGFYKKVKETKETLTLDWKTLDYKPKQKIKTESMGLLKGIEDPGQKLKTFLNASDKAAQFAWRSISRTLNYSAYRLGEIADDVVNIDRAMRWGFNWDQGPFEQLDALGVKAVVDRLAKDGEKVAPVLQAMGDGKFYPTPKTYFDVKAKGAKPVPVNPRAVPLPKEDKSKRVDFNASATLWDLGDHVLGIEFHTKMNSVDPDLITMLDKAVTEAEKNWAGLVVGNESATTFSAGANILLMLMAARAKQWDGIDQAVKNMQNAIMRLRNSDVPVVTAPFGMALGGGAEIAMGADAIRAHCELYMGLVEVGVGLLPSGGGCKELLFRAMSGIPDTMDPFAAIQKAFQAAAMAKVSMSAEEARENGFLAASDAVTMNRDLLIHDAKETVLGMARAGYHRPRPRTVRVAGEGGFAAFKAGLWAMEKGHAVSEHDRKVATAIARVFTGGAVAAGTVVDEQRILDLEREGFLSLIGEEKTQARMEFMLMNNKPLRN